MTSTKVIDISVPQPTSFDTSEIRDIFRFKGMRVAIRLRFAGLATSDVLLELIETSAERITFSDRSDNNLTVDLDQIETLTIIGFDKAKRPVTVNFDEIPAGQIVDMNTIGSGE